MEQISFNGTTNSSVESIVVDGISNTIVTNSNRPFKSVIELLPKSILAEVHQLIDKRYGGTYIRTFLNDRYKGNLQIPTQPTIDKYIKYYLKNRGQYLNSQQQIQLVQNNIDQLEDESEGIDTTDRKGLLEDLVNRCYVRLNALTTIIGNNPAPGAELLLQRYVSEVRELIKVLVTLKKDLKSDSDSIPADDARYELGQFLFTVHRVVRSYIPADKMNAFIEELTKAVRDTKEVYENSDIGSSSII